MCHLREFKHSAFCSQFVYGLLMHKKRFIFYRVVGSHQPTAGQSRVRSPAQTNVLLFSKTSKTALGPIQHLFKGYQKWSTGSRKVIQCREKEQNLYCLHPCMKSTGVYFPLLFNSFRNMAESDYWILSCPSVRVDHWNLKIFRKSVKKIQL